MESSKYTCFFTADISMLREILTAESKKGYRVTHYNTVVRHKREGETEKLVECVEHYVIMELQENNANAT